jgi:protein-S-isoprenylcysteine O-methyltransferase
MVFSFFQPGVFPSERFAFVFSVVFILILIVETRVLLRSRSADDGSRDLGLVLVGIIGPLVLAILFSYMGWGIISGLNYAGFFVMLVGFGLRQWSILILGKYFVPVVKVQNKQQVIETGPYRYVRHPSYTGLFLELVGVSLALSSLAGVLAVIVLFLPIFIRRMDREEKFLKERLEGYGNYMKKTKRLVPFVY